VAHGFTIDAYGPTSLRRNDLTLLRQSRINDRLAELQMGMAKQSKMFGDSIYPFQSHLMSYWTEDPDEFQARLNFSVKSVRIAIEWNYGYTSNLFHYLREVDKLKVMDDGVLIHVYTACVILRNCHIALYGGQSASYFDIAIESNMLEKLMRFN